MYMWKYHTNNDIFKVIVGMLVGSWLSIHL